jgi:hypothetical protein
VDGLHRHIFYTPLSVGRWENLLERVMKTSTRIFGMLEWLCIYWRLLSRYISILLSFFDQTKKAFSCRRRAASKRSECMLATSECIDWPVSQLASSRGILKRFFPPIPMWWAMLTCTTLDQNSGVLRRNNIIYTPPLLPVGVFPLPQNVTIWPFAPWGTLFQCTRRLLGPYAHANWISSPLCILAAPKPDATHHSHAVKVGMNYETIDLQGLHFGCSRNLPTNRINFRTHKNTSTLFCLFIAFQPQARKNKL